jgi:hypothetical protein
MAKREAGIPEFSVAVMDQRLSRRHTLVIARLDRAIQSSLKCRGTGRPPEFIPDVIGGGHDG